MRTIRTIVALILSCGAGVAGGAGGSVAPDCEAARRSHGWCEEAGVGFVGSVTVRSRLLHEALDTHGHDFDPAAITCESCREAFRSDGFCPAHRIGFVEGRGYLSPLTYHLARGRTIDPESLRCPTCRRNAGSIGWCEEHGIGLMGSTAVDDRRAFEELVRDHDLLRAAVKLSETCETCAAAMVADGYCPAHRIRYRSGKAVSPATDERGGRKPPHEHDRGDH